MAPLNLGLLDHMERHRVEAEQFAHTVNPGAGPAPQGAALYAWLDAATANVDEQKRIARDAMERQHALANAIAAGDVNVIRRQACPRCLCWGLVWSREERAAVCLNAQCVDRAGRPSAWTLGRLGAAAVAKSPVRRAT